MDSSADDDEYKFRHGLFVRGFGENVDEQQLQHSFESIGKVVRVQTGQPGLAFVDMDNDKDCQEAIRLLDGTEIGGQKISVARAKGPVSSRDRILNPPNTFRCYNCSKPGHLARECKEKPRNPAYADTKGTKLADVGRRYHPYERPMERRSSDPRDDRMRDDRGRDDRMREPQRVRGDTFRDPYPDDRQRDTRFNGYDRLRDERLRDDRLRDERMRDDRLRDDRYREERYRDDRDLGMGRPFDTGRSLYGSSMSIDPRDMARGRSPPPPVRRDADRFRETDRVMRNDRFMDDRSRPPRFEDRPSSSYSRDYRPERPTVRSDYRPASRPDDRFNGRTDFSQSRRMEDFPQDRRPNMDSYNSSRRPTYGGRDYERPRSPSSYGNGSSGMMGGSGGQGGISERDRDYGRSYGRSPPRDTKRDDSVRMGQSGSSDRFSKGYGGRPSSPPSFPRNRSYDDYPPRSRSPERFRAKTPPPHSPRSPASQSTELEKQQRTP